MKPILHATYSRIGSVRLSAPLVLPMRDELDRVLGHEIATVDAYGLGGLAEAGYRFSTIWDVGGCCGFFSAAALKLWPEAQVVVWEPNPASCEKIQALLPTVRLRQAAAAGHSGDGEFIKILNHWNQGISTLVGRPWEYYDYSTEYDVERIPVTLERPDDVEGAPDLLKLDCEGAEWEILPTLDARPQVIVGEWHGTDLDFGSAQRRLHLQRPEYHWLTFPWNSMFRGVLLD